MSSQSHSQAMEYTATKTTTLEGPKQPCDLARTLSNWQQWIIWHCELKKCYVIWRVIWDQTGGQGQLWLTWCDWNGQQHPSNALTNIDLILLATPHFATLSPPALSSMTTSAVPYIEWSMGSMEELTSTHLATELNPVVELIASCSFLLSWEMGIPTSPKS